MMVTSPQRPPLSVKTRLLAAAALWIAIAWLGGAATLSFSFDQAVRTRFDLKLKTALNAVAGAVQENPTDDGTSLGVTLRPIREPRFQIEGSGWYWQIKTDDKILKRSPSLGDFVLPLDLSVEAGEVRYERDSGPGGASLRAAQTALYLPDGRKAVVKVAVDDTDVQEEIDYFDTLIHLSLGSLGIGLTAAVLFQVQLGLYPLRRLAVELRRLKAGEQAALSTNYPPEIEVAANAVNEVMAQNRAVIERARQTASNLAHALKTELALVKTKLSEDLCDPEQVQDLRDHVDHISQIIDHHLSRAVPAGSTASAAARIAVADVVEEICTALNRVFTSRGVTVDCHIQARPRFRGERQDLDEMIGNLVENACKHANSRVLVALMIKEDETPQTVIRIDDDGSGMTDAQVLQAVERGKRLDERIPGTGLGLSIVNDLAETYGGNLELTRSALGGLLAILRLPAA